MAVTERTMKLYRVNTDLRPYSSVGVEYNYAYVIAHSMDEAAEIYRRFLDENNLGFSSTRTITSVELIAEEDRYPECRVLLFIAKEE